MLLIMEFVYISTAILLLCLSQATQSVNVIQPPSGSVVSAPVNTINATTLRCDFNNPSNNGQLQLVDWSLGTSQLTNDDPNFPHFLQHGEINAGLSLNNLLTILKFASELDGQTLKCQGGNTGIAANFSLVVFRKPSGITDITPEKSDTWIRVSWQVLDLGTPPISYYWVSLETTDSLGSTNITAKVDAPARATTFSNLLPNTTYVVTVTSFTILTQSEQSGQSATTEPILTELPQDTVPYLLMKSIEQPCKVLLTNRTAYDILLAETTNAVLSEIQNNCNCSYRMEYLHDVGLNCSAQFNESVVQFQTSMLVTPQWTREQSLAFAAQAIPLTSTTSSSSNSDSSASSSSPTTLGASGNTQSPEETALPVAIPAAIAAVIIVAAVIGVVVVLVIVWIALKRRKKLKALPTETMGSIVAKPLNEHKIDLGQEISDKQKLPDHNLKKKLDQHQHSISDTLQLEKLEKMGLQATNNMYSNEAKASPQNGVKHNKPGVPLPSKNAVNNSVSNTDWSVENSMKAVPLQELDMYEMMEAMRKNPEQTSQPSQVPQTSSDNGGSVELDTYAVIEIFKNKEAKVAAPPPNPPSTQASHTNIELNLYQTIDAVKDKEEPDHKKTSFITAAPNTPPPNPPPNDKPPDPPTPLIYAEVAIPRGKSIKGRHNLPASSDNVMTNEKPTDGQVHSSTQVSTSDTKNENVTTGKSDPQTSNEDFTVRGTEVEVTIHERMTNKERKGTEQKEIGDNNGSESQTHEEQVEETAPPVPPETTAKYITAETTEVEENLYADCNPTSVRAAGPAITFKHAPCPSSAIPPSGTPQPTALHSSTLPLHSQLPNTPQLQQDETETANLPGKWNTLRPKLRGKATKESDKVKQRKASLESKAGMSLQTEDSGLGNRAQSMTSLLEPDKETGKKTPLAINKVAGLKSVVGLWKKKATEGSLSPSRKGEEGSKKEVPRDGKSPSTTIISSPQLVASTPEQDLVYAELNTTARTPMPTVTKLSPMATQKPLLESKEFPSISQLVNEAKRKQHPPIEDFNLTGRPGSPQIGSSSPKSYHQSRDEGVLPQYQEDQVYEVMTNIAKSSQKSPTEEQLYETMTGAVCRSQNMTPTADQEYEVMTNIRPKHR